MERHCVRCFLFMERLARHSRRRARPRARALRRPAARRRPLRLGLARWRIYGRGRHLREQLFLDSGATPERAELCARDLLTAPRSARTMGPRARGRVHALRRPDRGQRRPPAGRHSTRRGSRGLRRGAARRLLSQCRGPGRCALIAPADDAATDLQVELSMARIDPPQDPLFARINASIGFDQRLWREDIAGLARSRRRARGGRRARRRRARRARARARAVGAELEAGRVRLRRTTTRTSTWRSSAG